MDSLDPLSCRYACNVDSAGPLKTSWPVLSYICNLLAEYASKLNITWETEVLEVQALAYEC